MSVPDLKQELITLLTAALTPITPHYARELAPPDDYEVVWINGLTNWRRGGGEQTREESGALAIGVDVYQPGRNPVTADARRWEIINLIDAALMEADFGGYRDRGVLIQREDSLEGYESGWLAHSILDISTDEEI